jgi:phospho-N-acetylmuramoyl-pentapeptide-transferase
MIEILLAGAFALGISLFGTPVLIRGLAARGYGQVIREDGPQSHHVKRGTPTMGGIIIIVAVATAYFLTHIITQVSVSASDSCFLIIVHASVSSTKSVSSG